MICNRDVPVSKAVSGRYDHSGMVTVRKQHDCARIMEAHQVVHHFVVLCLSLCLVNLVAVRDAYAILLRQGFHRLKDWVT